MTSGESIFFTSVRKNM